MRSPEAMPAPASSPEEGAQDKKAKKRHLKVVTEEEAAPDLTHELDDPKDAARFKKAHETLAPDMTEEAHEVDPRDAARYREARAALDAAPDTRETMPSTPPPIPQPKKKSAWQRFKGFLGR